MEMIELKINGEVRQVQVEKNWTLLYVLREVLDLINETGGLLAWYKVLLLSKITQF